MYRINKKIKKSLAGWTRKFYEEGLSTGKDAGDLSIKDPETNLIYICPTPSEKLKIPNWGVIKAKDIVVIDINGNKVEKTDIGPTIEYPMHIKLYNMRPEINAIVHSHALWSTVFAVANKDIPTEIREFNFVKGPVKCAKYAEAGTEELADYIVEAMGENCKAALLANHGAVAVGKDIIEAFNVAVYLEKIAKVAIHVKVIEN